MDASQASLIWPPTSDRYFLQSLAFQEHEACEWKWTEALTETQGQTFVPESVILTELYMY